MKQGILAGGNFILDRVKMIDDYPPENALTNIRSESVSNGGAAFNVLTDLARMGFPHPLAGIGLVGDDEAGDYVLDQCNELGIDATQVSKTRDAPTSYTDVMTVRGAGRRTFFHCRGANALLGEEHFDFKNCSAKHFHLGYLLLMDRLDQSHKDGTVAGHVLKRAREAGMVTSVDVVSESGANFKTTVLPTLPHVDICFMNEFEAERSTGVSLASPSLTNLREAARQLLNAGVSQWAIIHFENGAYALGPSGEATIGRVNLPRHLLKGMTGAGDAFAAGVLFGLHESLEIRFCLEYGVCAAAACLRDASASAGVCELKECLEIGEHFGYADLD